MIASARDPRSGARDIVHRPAIDLIGVHIAKTPPITDDVDGAQDPDSVARGAVAA